MPVDFSCGRLDSISHERIWQMRLSEDVAFELKLLRVTPLQTMCGCASKYCGIYQLIYVV